MRLPDFINVRYSDYTKKYCCIVDTEKYNKYLLRRSTNELEDDVLQAEMITGLKLMKKIWHMIQNAEKVPFAIKDDDYFSVENYCFYWHHYFRLNLFARDDLECFWSIFSRYYAFNDEEIEQYLKYLNVKELEKNMFIDLSDDQWNMIRCYNELNN